MHTIYAIFVIFLRTKNLAEAAAVPQKKIRPRHYRHHLLRRQTPNPRQPPHLRHPPHPRRYRLPRRSRFLDARRAPQSVTSNGAGRMH